MDVLNTLEKNREVRFISLPKNRARARGSKGRKKKAPR